MGEYKGDVGTIYTNEASNSNLGDGDRRWEAWFEDFHIIGLGHTELDALEDAARMVADMNTLIIESITAIRAGSAAQGASGGG